MLFLSVFCIAHLGWSQATTFNYVGVMQNYTVPSGVTSITIQALGAEGGSSSGTPGGLGASITGTVSVTPGQVLKVLVGGQGGAGTQGGGGGGSFVTTSANIPLVIAGGGGGGYYPGYAFSSGNASGTTSTTGQNGIDGYNYQGTQGGTGGTGGNGGGVAGGIYYDSGAGGGGLYGNGASNGVAQPGIAFVNGGAGGAGGGTGGFGGFGGGGGGDWYSWTGGGGGGGYSGGGGGTFYGVGGGGGSYNGGSSQSNLAGVRSGNGQITITPLAPVCVTTASASPNSICAGGCTTLSGSVSGGGSGGTNTTYNFNGSAQGWSILSAGSWRRGRHR